MRWASVRSSAFHEALAAGGRGVHHNCLLVVDHDRAVVDHVARGALVLRTQRVAGESKISYLEMPGPFDTVLEVAQIVPEAHDLFAIVKAAAEWDGEARWRHLN